MKLQRLRVRNYRIHRDVDIEFAGGFTVLTAPNEFGKSTLVEAMHRALFLAHRSGGHARESMQSRFGGHPEVELWFTAAGKPWRLRKVFAGGASSQCELVDLDTRTELRSTAAEDHLASLTGRPAFGGRLGEVDAAWDHLWVWQGKATVDPLQTQAGRAELARALGNRAGMAEGMTLTAGDAELLRAVRAAVDATWSKSRKEVLRDSEPGSYQRRVDELRSQREAAAARRSARAGEAEILQQHRDELASVRAECDRLTPEVAVLEAKVAGLRPIVDGGKVLTLKLEQAVADSQRFEFAVRRCDVLASALQDAETAERIAAQEEANRRGDHDACATLVETLGRRLAEAEAALAQVHRHAAALRAQDEVATCRSELAAGQQARAKYVQQAEVVAASRQELAAALPITAKDVAAVEKAQRELEAAEARLSGAAAQIERTAGHSPLTVDGAPLAVGATLRVDRAIEIAHADGTRLQVRPGGGEVAALTADAGKRRASMRDLLTELGVADAAAARAAADTYAGRREALRSAEATLAALTDPTDDLARLPARLHQLETQAAALATAAGPLPAGCDAASMSQQLAAAEAGLEAARGTAADAKKRATTATAKWHEVSAVLGECRSRLAAAKSVAQAAANDAGPAAERSARQAELQAVVDGIELQLASIAPKAQELNLFETKLRTARNQLTGLTTRQQTLDGAIGVLEPRLVGERAEDLDATIDALDADIDRAQRSATAARLRAEADKLLLHTLEAIQAEQRERREQPFVDACAEYLAMAHGPGVRIGLAGDSEDKRRLGLVDRSAVGLGTFDFVDLSHGGQELTALAARLAMAEVLAAEQSDGALPLVLDDSATNVDPERLRQVGFLLAHAATRGVQVVFATCDTERATSLRAESVLRLPRPTWNSAAPISRTDAADTTPSADTTSATASGDDAAQLIAALRASGGEGSSRALRDALSWDKERFDAARDACVAAGAVVVPEGSRSLRLLASPA